MIYRYQYFFMSLLCTLGAVFPLLLAENLYGSFIWPLYFVALLAGIVFGAVFHLVIEADTSFLTGKNRFLINSLNLFRAVYYCFGAVCLISCFSIFTEESALFDVPSQYTAVFITAASVLTAAAGLRVMGRAAVIFGSFAALFFVIATFLQFTGGSFLRLMPYSLFEEQAYPEILVFAFGMMFGESSSVYVFKPEVKKQKNAALFGFLGTALGSILVFLLKLSGITSGGQTTWIKSVGYYMLESSVNYGAMLRSFGIIVVGVYFICALYRASVLLKGAFESMKAIYGFNNMRVLYIVIFALSAVSAEILAGDSQELTKMYFGIYITFTLISFSIFIILNLCIKILQRNMFKTREANKNNKSKAMN